MHSEPSLLVELADPILVHVIRHLTLPVAHNVSSPVLPYLNVLPRALVPNVTCAALVKLWWYSLDHSPSYTVTVWLLPMLLDLERRCGRPLLYSITGLGNAARRGDFATMDAWWDAGLLDTAALSGSATETVDLSPARHDGAEGKWLLQVIEWWRKRGLPWGGQQAIETDLVLASSSCAVGQDTCLQALEWWRVQGPLMVLKAPARALVTASSCGYTRVLDWWWQHFQSSVYCTADGIDAAVMDGQLNVLEWWASKFPFDQQHPGKPQAQQPAAVLKNVADLASKHGHTHILHWWFEAISGLSKKYHKRTEAAMDEAASRGHIEVLDFWLACSMHPNPHRRISLKFKWALDWACAAGRLPVLDWFAIHSEHWALNPGNPCPLLHWPERHAQSITVECLDWRVRNAICTHLSGRAMSLLSKDGRLDVLHWLTNNRIAFEGVTEPLAQASLAGHLDILDWWLQEIGMDALNAYVPPPLVLSSCSVAVLNWWYQKQITYPPPLPPHARTLSPHHAEQVAWAIEHGRGEPSAVVQLCIDSCVARGDYETLAWCLKTYPAPSKQALSLTRMRGRLDQVQFGLIEFLVMHHLLPNTAVKSEQHVLLADLVYQEQLSRMLASDGGLSLVDWIRKHYQVDDGHQSHVFALTPEDLDEARERGDLGLCRWAKQHGVVVREFGVDAFVS